ncbi:winged helix-turn-helix domain-containing protein [Shewanella sp. JM162201]|uniref:Winged helix-turn-helix domain-containing protein n=1 Tax=Shewanella jiangmenensis TaxID=2837387 RepID=A0ABS5V4U2_9GAMM|nr:winged helix-turn-helix domain-containing protein [Shewanella jiangmenensis]MBT1444073.1 winged helix-turn-helix domain-containing protein [Shewanella jiangmenensis]
MHQLTPYLIFEPSAKVLVDQRDDSQVPLTFSEAQVLAALLESPETIIAKEDLLSIGWPDRVVSMTSLTQCVSTLRKKLEPFPELQLKTVARRGYQLHISRQSHVHMLAINDGEAIKDALIGVSLRVKLAGIVLLGFILGAFWYLSDRHAMVKDVSRWQSGGDIPLNVGGSLVEAELFYLKDVDRLHPSMWQRHLAPEGNQLSDYGPLSGFAATDGNNYSFAVCPGESPTDCSGKRIINITSIGEEPAGLSMAEFLPLSRQMEERIRYNKVILPEAQAGGEIEEHNFQADVYFPVAGELLVRADLSLSLVYEGADTGQFHVSACITDENCITTPIKYRLRGAFTQYQSRIGSMDVDVFQVKVLQKTLEKPDNVSGSALHFYREIRKHDIRDDTLYFYRVWQGKDTAVWIVPQIGHILAWTRYTRALL